MDGDTIRDAVERSKATELDRLGSNKLLVALTGAALEPDRVLDAAAASEHAAAETFREWAADEAHAGAQATFEAVADQEADHLDRVAIHIDDFEPPDAAGPMHAYLRGLDGTIERAGAGLIGRPLVSSRSHTQVISFFINEADRAMTDLFRDLKAETEDELDRGVELLPQICGTDEEWERAEAAAEYVIQVAYDDYADSLTGMGVDPKPIC